MANYEILNLSEQNVASEMIVGQANGTPVQQIHPQYGTIFNKQVAIERGRLVGLKADGKVYLASAEVGAGQVMALGFNFQECANGQGIDLMTANLEIDLGAPVAGAGPGKVAYLSPTTPGAVTVTKPSTTGQLIQIVGVFITNQVIKYNIHISGTVV